MGSTKTSTGPITSTVIDPPGQEATVRQFPFLTMADLQAMPLPTWLIDGVLPAASLAMLYGAPGCGKTFVAIDMAACVASGMAWHDHRVRHGLALYVTGEGASGLRLRLRAWESAFPGTKSLLDDLFRACTIPPQLMNDKQVSTLVQEIRELPESPSLVVLDTLARCAVGGDENSARDMGLLVDGADRIRKETGAAILLVHHAGKDAENFRGSSALHGAVDTMIEAKGEDGGIGLVCKKMKDAEPFQRLGLRMEQVVVEHDAEGRPVPSCRLFNCSIEDALNSNATIEQIRGVLVQSFSELGASIVDLEHATKKKRNRLYYNLNKMVHDGCVIHKSHRYFAAKDRG